MSKEKECGIPVTANIAGRIVKVSAGTAALGAALVTIESMKSHFTTPAAAAGTFVIATAIVVGNMISIDDIIGYFYPATEDESALVGSDSDI